MTEPVQPEQLQKRRIPPLIALRAFEAVGRTGSVRAAAQELGVNHSAISRHIRNLELHLGVRLLEARGRGVGLTRLGARYLDDISDAFHSIGRATDELSPTGRQPFEIWCTPGLARRRLLRTLPALQTALARDVILRPTLANPALVGGHPDAEVMYLTHPVTRSKTHFELLSEPRVLAVASPEFRARHPSALRVEDLIKMPLLHERSTHQWSLWLRLNNVRRLPSIRGSLLWHGDVTIEAAMLSQGVALANELLIEDLLQDGRLVEIVPTSTRLGAYHLILSERQYHDKSTALLREWLKDTLRSIGA